MNGVSEPFTMWPLYMLWFSQYLFLFSAKIVFRDCDKGNVTNKCGTKELKGEIVDICYDVCDTDGCNALPQKASSAGLCNHLPAFAFTFLLGHVTWI